MLCAFQPLPVDRSVNPERAAHRPRNAAPYMGGGEKLYLFICICMCKKYIYICMYVCMHACMHCNVMYCTVL